MRNQNLTSIKSSAGKNEGQKTFSGWRSALVDNWATAWKVPSFKWKFLVGMIVLACILVAFPFFFNAIEDRNGHIMPDFVLEWIPARDVSVAVFFLIWSCGLILLIRICYDPMMMLVAIWAYNAVTLVRMAFISVISLNPPAGLIPLADPITNHFYGGRYITHDLFFSGHMTTVFLIFLCLKKKPDRIYALLASVTLGFLLLLQHVHYTIDVLAAPVFTYAIYRLALLFTKPENESLIKAGILKN